VAKKKNGKHEIHYMLPDGTYTRSKRKFEAALKALGIKPAYRPNGFPIYQGPGYTTLTAAKMPPLGKVGKTPRGFPRIEFLDHYGMPCSVQCSSLALCAAPGASALWLGSDQPRQISGETFARMHLVRCQVAALVKVLETWLAFGHLGNESRPESKPRPAPKKS